jgi:hypothetical protein
MDKKLVAIAVVAVVDLIVAMVSLAFAFSVISTYQSKSPTSTPALTSTYPNSTPPSTTTQPSSTPTAVTSPFSPKVTFSPLSDNGSAAPLMFLNTSTHIASGTYGFSINVTNPASSAASPQPCNIQFVLTEVDKNSASPTDATLGIDTQGRDPLYGEPTVMYSVYAQINAAAYGNRLTYLFAPAGNYWEDYIDYLSPNGFTVTSGFNETFSMQIVFNVSFGEHSVAVNVVPAA